MSSAVVGLALATSLDIWQVAGSGDIPSETRTPALRIRRKDTPNRPGSATPAYGLGSRDVSGARSVCHLPDRTVV